MQAELKWKGKMLFEGMPGTGHKVMFDTVEESGGTDTAATPMEHMLLALGACTAMDVITILKKMRQEVTDYSVQLRAERNDKHPRYFTEVVVEHRLRGKHLDPEAVQRAVSLSDEVYCSATASLRQPVPVSSRFIIEEAG